MKIGLVCPWNMFEHAGGVQEVVINLAKGLRAKNYEVRIITPRPASFRGAAPEGYIFLGTSRRLNGTLSTVLDVGIEVDGDEIDKMLEREKFDVINFHEPWIPVLARQIAMKAKDVAMVGTFHASLPDSLAAKSIVNLFTPYGRSITEKMHLLTATGPAAAAVLLNKGINTGISAALIKNLKYIPVAVDLKFYRPLKKRTNLSGPGTKTIVYIGRPDKRKGIDWLLLAFAELVREMPEARLMIAGDGSRLSRLKLIVQQKKIPGVDFLGYVSEERKKELLGNADIACFPSLYGEGFGIVLLEAMSMGTPLIAGDNPGYRSVMRGTGRICLVDPKSTDDFANRLAVLISDQNLRRLLSEWSIKEVKQYNYPLIIAQYEAAYKEAFELMKSSKAKEEDSGEKPRRKVVRWPFVRRHARQ